jgi:5-methylthioadenosine/S-adenosylhomocysteine deaminase
VRTVLSADWVLPIEGEPIRDGAVAIEGGRIAAVGTRAELGSDEHHDDAVILPGFVNAHSHLEYAVYGGFGDGLTDFAEWIAMHVQRKGRIGWDESLAIARLGAAECLGSGITTVGDCSYSGASAVACVELGLRATVYLEVFGKEPVTVLERFARLRERVEHAFGDLVRPGISPHAPYTVSAEAYAACAELGLPIATHLSESASELAYLRDGSGPWAGYADLLVPPTGETGVRMLERLGLLGRNLLAAHCVRVEPDEIAALARHGAGVAHCPRSNAAIGCGVAPLAELREAGVRVGIGTDSPASAPSFDFFEELRTVALSARARARRPDALLARDAVELATIGSARALDRDVELGSLLPGKRADLTVVSLEGSAYLPWEDPYAAVLWGGSPDRVAATFVDGEARYRKGGFAWHELRSAAASARARMLGPAPAVAQPA